MDHDDEEGAEIAHSGRGSVKSDLFGQSGTVVGGTWGHATSQKQKLSHKEIMERFLKKKAKNEANLRLSNFKKSFTQPAANGNVPTL